MAASRLLLYFSRTLGFILVFLYLFFAVALLADSIMYPSSEHSFDLYLFILILTLTFSYFLAWRHEGMGGLLMTILGIILNFYSDWQVAVPVFLCGQIFVLIWFLKSRALKNSSEV